MVKNYQAEFVKTINIEGSESFSDFPKEEKSKLPVKDFTAAISLKRLVIKRLKIQTLGFTSRTIRLDSRLPSLPLTKK